MARLTGFPVLGVFAGALTFFGSDALIAKFGGGKRTDLDASTQSKLVVPMVLANSMISEAYEHGGKFAGVFTVLGFCASVAIIVFEHSL